MIATITGIGTGVAPVVNVTFPYLDKAHVKASIDGTPTGLVWTGTSQVQLASPAPSGAAWSVYRETPTSPALVDFSDAAPITEEDLDKANTAHRYREQELTDEIVGNEGRSIRAPLGETLSPLPPARDRIGTIAGFSSNGDVSLTALSAINYSDAQAKIADSRAVLAAYTGMATRQAAFLSEPGREGSFIWSPSDLSSSVSGDTHQGVYVAPASDPTGASGAWVRQLYNPNVLHVSWFGVTSANDEETNTSIIDSILAEHLPGSLTLIFPEGVIQGRVQIPYLSGGDLSTLTIRGETAPATWFGTIAGPPYMMSEKGAILQSTAAALSPTEGGVVEAQTDAGFSNIRVVVRDIVIRTYDNPNQHGINAYNAQQLTVENVSVDTGVWSTSASQPTHVVYGIRTPQVNNGAFTSLRDVSISGYYVGHDVSEHFDGDNIAVDAAIYGVEFLLSVHPSRIGRLLIQRCQTPILADSGLHRTSIQMLAIEHANPDQTTQSGGIDVPGNPLVGNGWQVTNYDIDDVFNYLSGDIVYNVVLGGVGNGSPLTLKGGGGRNVFIREAGKSTTGFLFIPGAGVVLPNNVTTYLPFISNLGTSGIAARAGDESFLDVTLPGLYQLTFDGSVPPGATGKIVMAIELNGSVIARQEVAAGGSLASLHVHREAFPLVAGDVVRVSAFQDSGADATLTQTSYSGGLTTHRLAANFG